MEISSLMGRGLALIWHSLLAGLTATGRSLGAGEHTVALSLHDAFSAFAVIRISAYPLTATSILHREHPDESMAQPAQHSAPCWYQRLLQSHG